MMRITRLLLLTSVFTSVPVSIQARAIDAHNIDAYSISVSESAYHVIPLTRTIDQSISKTAQAPTPSSAVPSVEGSPASAQTPRINGGASVLVAPATNKKVVSGRTAGSASVTRLPLSPPTPSSAVLPVAGSPAPAPTVGASAPTSGLHVSDVVPSCLPPSHDTRSEDIRIPDPTTAPILTASVPIPGLPVSGIVPNGVASSLDSRPGLTSLESHRNRLSMIVAQECVSLSTEKNLAELLKEAEAHPEDSIVNYLAVEKEIIQRAEKRAEWATRRNTLLDGMKLHKETNPQKYFELQKEYFAFQVEKQRQYAEWYPNQANYYQQEIEKIMQEEEWAKREKTLEENTEAYFAFQVEKQRQYAKWYPDQARNFNQAAENFMGQQEAVWKQEAWNMAQNSSAWHALQARKSRQYAAWYPDQADKHNADAKKSDFDAMVVAQEAVWKQEAWNMAQNSSAWHALQARKSRQYAEWYPDQADKHNADAKKSDFDAMVVAQEAAWNQEAWNMTQNSAEWHALQARKSRQYAEWYPAEADKHNADAEKSDFDAMVAAQEAVWNQEALQILQGSTAWYTLLAKRTRQYAKWYPEYEGAYNQKADEQEKLAVGADERLRQEEIRRQEELRRLEEIRRKEDEEVQRAREEIRRQEEAAEARRRAEVAAQRAREAEARRQAEPEARRRQGAGQTAAPLSNSEFDRIRNDFIQQLRAVSADQRNKLYKKLQLENHPDRHVGKSQEELAKYGEKTKALVAAWESVNK